MRHIDFYAISRMWPDIRGQKHEKEIDWVPTEPRQPELGSSPTVSLHSDLMAQLATALLCGRRAGLCTLILTSQENASSSCAKTKRLNARAICRKAEYQWPSFGKDRTRGRHCFHRFVGRSSHFTEHHLRFFDSGRIGHSTGKGVECTDQEAESEYPELQK